MSVYDNLVGRQDIFDEFIDHSSDLLRGTKEDLQRLEPDLDAESLNCIIRLFHNIKGICGLLGFEQAKMVAHVSENLLNQMRNGNLAPGGEIIAVLQESCDWLERFLGDIIERQKREYEIWPFLKRVHLTYQGDGQHAEVEVLRWLMSARLNETKKLVAAKEAVTALNE